MSLRAVTDAVGRMASQKTFCGVAAADDGTQVAMEAFGERGK